ncbi:MAG: hypothetical protein CSB44_08150 [Gammaproteobacteria bacterium]|nr:MAG: hypothetical protein CSB44_08150 [Gammaproteobacteria bacterium]PIE36896.1 MAG: hypothetical protein CSA54_02890 [Gammaproteobacteria bacterium]
MPSLYYEVFVCVVVASLAGFFCGWMLLRSTSQRRITGITRHWENKYTDFAHSSDLEIQELEARIVELGDELREQNDINSELRGTVRLLENQSRQAQDEAIRTNKATTEAQSRMQQLLHTKASTLLAENAMEIEADTFDQTVRIDPGQRHTTTMPPIDEFDDEQLDATTALADSSFDTEESTIALDRETLDALRRSSEG